MRLLPSSCHAGARQMAIDSLLLELRLIQATEASYLLAFAGPSSLASPEATMERTTWARARPSG